MQRDTDHATSLTQGFILLLVFVGAGAFLYDVRAILMPFIVAFVIAYILKPLMVWMGAWKIPTAYSAFLLVFGFLILVVTAFLFAIPLLQKELVLLAKKLPGYIEAVEHTITPILQQLLSYIDEKTIAQVQETLAKQFGTMFAWFLQIFAGLLTNTLVLANVISLIILTPLVTFYVLKDWAAIEEFFNDLMPHSMKKTTQKLAKQIEQMLSGYFRGQSLVCLTLAAYYILALSLAGLNFSFTIGFISGLLLFVPYVGFFIGFAVAMGVAIAQFQSLNAALMILGIYGVGQVLEGMWLTPKLVGGRIGVHPAWIIFALLAGGVLAGFLGVLIAVPVAGILGILIRYGILRYQQSTFYQGVHRKKVHKK